MIIRTAQDARDLLQPILRAADVEKVAVAHLGQRQELLRVVEQEGGGADAIDLPIRTIIAEALRCGSLGLVVAHNHPSGDASPSAADILATRELAETASRLGIRLHDHLIFAGADCRSFRALGLL